MQPGWHKVIKFALQADAHPGRHEPDIAVNRYLNGGGHDAPNWSSIGPRSAKDREICELCSHTPVRGDLEFPQILAQTRERGPVVILLRGDHGCPISRSGAFGGALRM